MAKKRKYWYIGTDDIEVSQNFQGRVNIALGRFVERDENFIRNCGAGRVLLVPLKIGEQNQFIKERGARFRLGKLRLFFNFDNGQAVEKFDLPDLEPSS